MTPSGIEPATFRFVAQHLNHCATAVPTWRIIIIIANMNMESIKRIGIYKISSQTKSKAERANCSRALYIYIYIYIYLLLILAYVLP